MYQQKTKVDSSLTFKISCEYSSFYIGIGSSPLTKRCHKEHNDTYYDLPSIFLLDEVAFKSHSWAQIWSLRK